MKTDNNAARKMVPVSLETHAKLTRLVAKEIVKGRGLKRVTYNDVITQLLS